MNQLIRPAKKALSEKYGYKNVTVRNGQGTAWGWVECRIDVKKPETNCTKAHTPWDTCYTCQDARRAISNEAEALMYKAWQKEGLKPYTYLTDDGIGTDRNEVLIDVNYI